MNNNEAIEKKLPETPEPFWREHIVIDKFGELTEDLTVDVAIVGGGITGITSAYQLATSGVKVALLDAGVLLNGTTGHTTAKITAQHDLIYDEFIQHFGKSKTRLYYEANLEALHFIKKTINDHQISCDFSNEDAYLYSTTEQSARKIEKEFEAYEKLHIDGKLLSDIPFNFKVQNALMMPGQAQFHPLKYLTELVKGITKAGGLVFENTVAVNIEGDGQPSSVLTQNGKRVTATYILCCSHFPFYEGSGFYFTRMYAERSYILAAKTSMDYPGGMYLSVDKPSRSIRSAEANGEKVVLIGGESHKTGQGSDMLDHYKTLVQFGEQELNIGDIINRWSTQDLTTLDKLPYVGPISVAKPNILIATGFRKWGMTNGTAAGLLLSDIVMNKKNPYAELYTPSRFYADPSLKTFFMENIDVAKHLIKGKLEIPVKEAHELKNDEGSVVLINGARKGAYRDNDGQLHIVDTTCTHIGCECNWNDGDRTWDCPCHGSRFSYTGEVIEGPAEKPLQREEHTMLDNLTSEDSGY